MTQKSLPGFKVGSEVGSEASLCASRYRRSHGWAVSVAPDWLARPPST